jgi:hypothetical protein
MPAATVLIPTHSHVEPLRLAVAGAQEQTLGDIEIFIVGDGVTEATRALVAGLAAGDRRIRFFDFPKGARKGEAHRHQALQHASGRFVAYLGDDDCWLPDHLSVLDDLLREADFGHTLHIGVGPGGELFAHFADLENPDFRALMLTSHFNRFDFTFAGHTLAAYRRVPHGWRTTPPDFPWTDLYMWRQFLAEPWCRARSAMVPTCICTHTHLRPHLGDRERAEDLAHWRIEAARPGFREALWRKIGPSMAREAVRQEMTSVRQEAEVIRYRGQAAHHEARACHFVGELAATCARLETEANAANTALSRQLAAMRGSTSWRMTRPLRGARRLAGRVLGSPGSAGPAS